MNNIVICPVCEGIGSVNEVEGGYLIYRHSAFGLVPVNYVEKTETGNILTCSRCKGGGTIGVDTEVV